MENKWHCIMMAGKTKRDCFSGRKSYLSLSVSSFIHRSTSIQPIRHPLSASDICSGWLLWLQGRGVPNMEPHTPSVILSHPL